MHGRSLAGNVGRLHEGFLEVEMEFVEQHKDGDFQFNFIHKVTGKVATLEIHGFTKEQCQKFMFHHRVYLRPNLTNKN